jgi:hypothetical protein
LCPPTSTEGDPGCYGYPWEGPNTVYEYGLGDDQNYITNWTLEYDNDSSGAYTTLSTGAIPWAPQIVHSFVVPTQIWRIKITASSPTHSIGAYELEAYQ